MLKNDLFLKSLPNKYKNRVVSAEKIAIGWLETRSTMEMELYPNIFKYTICNGLCIS